ncbi:MAG: methyltransferase domain-containing protein [Candidatus Euphemobacter frigidus]|nr:methyltransferase domain-containing protein [Candidatus Euphemobacter frigidus]MDP8275121.1 methyltransferase domain-containing protein [Candidatus Euphemobacter frigidus]
MLPSIPTDVYGLYDGLKFWERWHVKLRWRLCPFLQIAGYIPEAARIVDIGCGRGLLANYLALNSSSREVTGIDKQEKRIEAARASIKGRDNIRFYLRDVLELHHQEFDVIVVSDMLHHLTYPQQEKLLRHCYRILPAGGILLVEDVSEKPKWKWFAHFLIDRFLNLGRRQYYRKIDDWISYLESLGFEVKSFDAHRHIPLPDFLLKCGKGEHIL